MTVKGPATPAALYKMITIPEAQKMVLKEAHPVGKMSVSLHEAVGKVLADSVKAIDDLPPFPASIKVRFILRCACQLHVFECFESLIRTAKNQERGNPQILVRCAGGMLQDGYAVRVADGGEVFEVEFDAVAGTAQRKLSPGKIAYIGTG
jgi:hypothetical protein